ncbi:FMN-binding negative transcriptional regulator [Agarivorans sp. QJM3NY_29]|uniref:FMN-binding negative transcriptional regulator n=1 Tax=unclassified Agarivorans TaxID=2636026 RepID=UPI003D7DCD34
MYLPKPFIQDDWSSTVELLGNYPLACIVSQSATGLVAEHIPLLLLEVQPEQWVLRGHIAKGNPLANRLAQPLPVLVIFQAEQAYISPNYYPTKQSDPRVVPTWNYQVVHINGQLRGIDDSQWKLALLAELTKTHEAQQLQPWQLRDAPESYIEQLNKAILGIEVSVEQVQAKSKMSQNQSPQNQAGVLRGLAERQHPMAEVLARQISGIQSESK